MRKFLISLFVCIFLLGVASTSNAATKRYGRGAYIGGTDSVDNIPFTPLENGDLCLVQNGNDRHEFMFDSSSAAAENVSSFPMVIKPDDAGASNGRWVSLYMISGTTADTTPTSDDLIYLLNSPGSSPSGKYSTLANLFWNISSARINAELLLSATQTFSANDTTPSIDGFNFFKTNNDTTTKIITALDGGVARQIVFIVIDDDFTDVDFTGTNLKGHGGIDWEPSQYDFMICTYDGTYWYCNVSRPTGLAISEYNGMPFDSTPDTNLSWSGPETEYENGSGSTIAQGKLVYLRSDGAGQEGAIWPWDADLATYKNYKPEGIVVQSGGIADGATGTVGIWWGKWRDDSLNFTDNVDEGKPIYGTTTAGAVSVTAPAVSGDIVCCVGKVFDDDIIDYNFGLCSSVEVP